MTKSTSPPTPPTMPAIDYYRDLSSLDHLIESKPGMFWCYSHLADMPLTEQSPDQRYCNACNAVLTRERADLRGSGNRKKPWWAPQNVKEPGKRIVVADNRITQVMPVSEGQISAVDKTNQTLRHGKERKAHPPPVQLIKQLSFDGMKSKAKAAKLRAKETLGRRLRKAVPV
jgi:hypothetical protein